MKRKLKLLNVGMIILFGVIILSFMPYGLNAVEQPESSVSYEQPKANENRGFEQSIIQTSEITYKTEIEIPIAGIDLLLNEVSDDDIVTKSVEEIANYSEVEIEILERIAEAEATSGNIKSKENIVSVILNRVSSTSFPDTIEKVVFQHTKNYYQFSSVGDKRYFKVNITNETKEAVRNVIENGRTTEALYFFNMKDVQSNKIKKWISNRLTFVFKDDINHSFYKER